MEDDGDASSGLLGVRKTLGHNELPAVERHVIVFRNIRLQRILVAVPRILDIHVLVLQQACHLQMARNLGAAERGIIEVLSNEWLFVEVDVGSLYDFDAPFSVKALREIGVLVTLRIMRAGVRLTSNTVASVSHVSDACSTRLLFAMFPAFFHYFVVNDVEAKLPLLVMINVFY